MKRISESIDVPLKPDLGFVKSDADRDVLVVL